jgi:hypothetical protein
MRSIIFLTVVLALAVGRLLSAHHSYAGFDVDPTTVEGKVEVLKIANPHTLIEIRGDDDQRYVVVWSALNGLVRRGLITSGPGNLAEILKPGTRITVVGRLKREDSGIAMLPQTIDVPSYGQIWGER